MNEAGQDLVMASEDPKVDEVIAEFKRCSPWRAGKGWNRLETNDAVRDCWWEGQTADGRKHSTESKPAKPWPGASDTRVHLAGSLCEDQVEVLVVSFYRAMLRAVGVQTSGDAAAAAMTRLMEWMMQVKQLKDLALEVELSAQYWVTYGVVVLHPFMDREVSMCLKKLSLAELQAAADTGDAEAGLMLQLALSEATEDEAVAMVQEKARGLVAAHFASEVPDLDLLRDYAVSKGRARKFVRGLREEGEAELPLPYVTRNQPVILALKPWDEVFFPDYVGDIQKAPVVFRRAWMTEVEARAKVATEGWSEAWVEAAAQCKGKVSLWSSDYDTGGGEWYPDTSAEHDLIEVIYAHRLCVDEDGVQSRWTTVFHADVPGQCAQHRMDGLDHAQAPFVAGAREWRARNLGSSRGIPELVVTQQGEMKGLRDALMDHTSLCVTPPIMAPSDAMGNQFRFGPGVINPLVSMSKRPEFMEIPMKGAPLAIEMSQRLEVETDLRFGRLRPEMPPARAQVKMEFAVGKFLRMWTLAFQQQVDLVEQLMSDETFMRITGAETPLPRGRRNGANEDFLLHFDARELDMDFVVKQYDAIVKGVLPVDAAGVIDRAKLVRLMLRAINPSIAKEITNDTQGASQAVFREVQNDLMLMFTGNEPEYLRDADPTASMRLQFAGQIVQANPKYQQAMQGDAVFAERLTKYAESLQFNVAQEKNKVVGRTGVAQEPVGA